MSATAPRITQANPDMRPLGIALGALTLAVALLVTVTVSRLDTSASVAAPAAAAPIVHDHGWIESTYAVGPQLTVNGFDKAHAVNAAQSNALIIETENGGLNYTGIPYPAPADSGTGGSNGTQFAR
jgi:hypothetical protein